MFEDRSIQSVRESGQSNVIVVMESVSLVPATVQQIT